MALSINWGPFCGCPDKEGPNYLGSTLGAPDFGKSPTENPVSQNERSKGQYVRRFGGSVLFSLVNYGKLKRGHP